MTDVPQYGTASTNSTGNSRSGKSFFRQKGPRGGSWHVYDNGKKVFVPKKKKKTPVGPGTKFPGAQTNTTKNARSGQSYFSSAYKGGEYHSYGSGKKIFVKKKP